MSLTGSTYAPDGEFTVIEWAGDSTYVYVLTDSVKGQDFRRTAVTTGLSDGINIQVTSGISADTPLRGAIKADKPNK